ncbi:MAG TPA: hypothetical protein VFE01_10485 [Terracidiphilus sp.]|jgi:hypothetical protein|nr:hypothetical protein [Terracidiphilus sp.]
MTTEAKPTQPGDTSDKSSSLEWTHTQPGGLQGENTEPDDGLVNDSFGTVDIADSTGLDEDKETGDAKKLNKNTRED